MANLIFYYGAMGCSKSANALMTRFQYNERGLSVWLIKPATDTRDDIEQSNEIIKTLIKSRVGISCEAEVIKSTDSILAQLNKKLEKAERVNLIICDEAQFLIEEQVDELKAIAEKLDIPVYCYGLRTDFKTKLFEGSKRLFELASKVVEIESVCSCGKPAVINARFSKGKLMTRGAQIELGGDEKYKALCYSCWKDLTKESE